MHTAFEVLTVPFKSFHYFPRLNLWVKRFIERCAAEPGTDSNSSESWMLQFTVCRDQSGDDCAGLWEGGGLDPVVFAVLDC